MDEIRVYGKPTSVGEHGARKYSSRNRTENDLRKDLEMRLKDYNVKYILLDEVQHLFKYGGMASQRSLDILKNISNKTDCRFICLGTYETMFSVDQSAQLSRRIMTIEFPSYSIDSERDYKNFLAAYSGLLAHIPMEISEDLNNFRKSAFLGCCGCIGILKEWLNRAMIRSLSEKAILSSSHLKSTRLKGSQLKSIAQEIREGKLYFDEPGDDEILELLSMRDRQKQNRNNRSSPRRNTSPKPGVRKPKRDEI
jgi:hypothetical protein